MLSTSSLCFVTAFCDMLAIFASENPKVRDQTFKDKIITNFSLTSYKKQHLNKKVVQNLILFLRLISKAKYLS